MTWNIYYIFLIYSKISVTVYNYIIVCLFETLPPRGFRVDSDLNLALRLGWSPGLTWFTVLRRALTPCRGPAPLVVRSQHTYVRPARIHNACVVQCIGSIPHDVIQHRKPTTGLPIIRFNFFMRITNNFGLSIGISSRIFVSIL
jgi:hypothetical protein